MITENDKSALHDIKGTPGFRVMEHLVKVKIEELRDVSNISETSQIHAGIQALGRKLAVKLLQDFLSELGVINKPVKETNKTYE